MDIGRYLNVFDSVRFFCFFKTVICIVKGLWFRYTSSETGDGSFHTST